MSGVNISKEVFSVKQKAFLLASNPDLEKGTLLLARHCEHRQGAWQSL
jgi:hypothetical protein